MIAIKDVLKKFQEGYTNRNSETLDSYMEELFIHDDSILTIGTSRSEWCFGIDELKELIDSDWKYWGNVKVNYENSIINSKDNTAWFLADCNLTWNDTPEDFGEWCKDLLSDYYGDEGRFIRFNKMSKLTMLNIKLALLLYSSNHKKGAGVVNPLRLSGTLINKDNKWLIDMLHFSVPMPSYPEWRIDKNNPDSLKYFNEVKEKMSKYNESNPSEARVAITKVLTELQTSYLNKAIDVKAAVGNLFSSYDDTYIVDPNETPAAVGNESMEKLISEQRAKWDDMQLSIHEAIIRTYGDTALIATNGVFKRVLDSDMLLSKEWDKIKETLQKDGKGEDKLFEAQKQIAYALKELAFGEESLWEFRFEAVAIRENNVWKFHNLQFSYPSLYVLEGNYSMTPLL